MKIQSTLSRPAIASQRQELAKEFKEAKERFEVATEDHFQRSETYHKWGTRIGFSLGAGALVGGGLLVAKYAPGLDGYGAAFPAVAAGAATVAVAAYVTNKLVEKKLSQTDFQASRESLVDIRDQYRASLLQEVDDADVASITGARWMELKPYENVNAKQPTGVELKLLKQVEDLEFLADQRIAGGWQQALGHAVDDPVVLRREFAAVKRNDGIQKVMTDALG